MTQPEPPLHDMDHRQQRLHLRNKRKYAALEELTTEEAYYIFQAEWDSTQNHGRYALAELEFLGDCGHNDPQGHQPLFTFIPPPTPPGVPALSEEDETTQLALLYLASLRRYHHTVANGTASAREVSIARRDYVARRRWFSIQHHERYNRRIR